MNKYNLNNSFKAVVIGGSAGSFQGMVKVLSQLPKGFPLPIIMCLHRLKHVRNGFVEALSIKSVVQVTEPHDKENIKKGGVYLAPANYHMSVELGHYFALSTEEMVNNSRPAIDITLSTCGFVYKEKLIGILLSGANRDGAQGMRAIHEKGGLTIVQEPTECMIDTMPKAALAATKIDHVLRVDQIVEFFKELDKQYR
jgi:two-component system, chemotaxis family, protein-glutamate methylesterase/glutaminase